MATRTDPQFKPQAEAAKAPADEEAPRPRFEDRVKFEELGKYEEITLPPHARLKWLSAKLPSAPPEVLQDTVPPNGGVKAPPNGPARASSESAPPVEHPSSPAAIERSPLSNQETMLIPRVRRKRRLRDIVALTLGAAAMLTLVALVLWWHAPSDSDPKPALVETAAATTPPPRVETAVEPAKPVLPPPRTTVSAVPAASAASTKITAPAPSAKVSPVPAGAREPQSSRPSKPAPPATAKPTGPSNDFDMSKPWED